MEDLIYNRQKDMNISIPSKTIYIIGLGGVGFHVAKLLAMSGVLKLKLFDFDTIELSNLNRIDLPVSFIGKNKAEAVKSIILKLRPNCEVEVIPFKFSDKYIDKNNVEYIIDCTDKVSAQREHEKIAKNFGLLYQKIGYNGSHMTITKNIPNWSTEDDIDDQGYTVTPSWVVPSIVVASLGVSLILKYRTGNLSCDLKDLFIVK